jgi:hypothetical protein
MPKMFNLSETTARVRALFPADASLNTWYPLQNGFDGMLLANGSIDLRRKVRMVKGHDIYGWRIDRITASGKDKFIGYQPMTQLETALA